MEKRKKVGIMGGTFDPVHIGHLILGEAAYRQFDLDRIEFMPAGNPPHKRHREGRASDGERVEMVRRAIASNPHFTLSRREMNADGYSYTYRTLETLCTEHPDTDYYFIIGADSLFDFETWREPQRIVRACTLVVATRNQIAPEVFDREIQKKRDQYGGTFLKLDTPNLDIASSHLREMIRRGESVRYYIPDSVIDYILLNGIYRNNHEKESSGEHI
ncbi:MAG: nicotinate-nucleotide adenylyltransferase [Lachnospiraceae bacterium]|jgi:nicotinate-nucleotide adenylyltransferase|nr:nicotinate-nucleotide adenylyltransferase [Lachnospiraceae bacterium]MCI1329084.1 nicotinate-nucleotide adenylyltransferase [Lachnospiraceae bacterium]